MVMSAEEFLAQPYKRITLMGMSGAGKSYLTAMLEREGWHIYPCDHLLGEHYLRDEIVACGSDQNPDLSPINAYIGQVGNPALGGIPLDEFKRRQNLHYTAECNAMRDMVRQARDCGDMHFVHDSSGSLCELEDEDLLAQIGETTLLVYLKMGKEDEEELVRRAIAFPKSIYYPSMFFDAHLKEYMDFKGLQSAEEIVPPEFVRWVFPKLFAARLPKYDRLAQLYGVAISCAQFRDIHTDTQFLDVIAGALRERDHGQAEG